MHERYYVIGDCGSMDLHTVVEGLCKAAGQDRTLPERAPKRPYSA